jgi:hypothetical protein
MVFGSDIDSASSGYLFVPAKPFRRLNDNREFLDKNQPSVKKKIIFIQFSCLRPKIMPKLPQTANPYHCRHGFHATA